MQSSFVPKRLCVKQVSDILVRGQSTLRRWAKVWLTSGKPGLKRGPRPYQPDGPRTALFYLEHEVYAYLDPAYTKGV